VRLLVDTGALLAYLLRNDQHHREAASFVRQYPEARFVLTDLILSELITRLRARAGAPRAVAAGRSLLDSRRYNVVFVDAPLVRSGLARMEQFTDKALSLPDCVSFEVIDRLGLDGAFAFDRDFRDCGYRTFP
jgi:predicted nucleic acid-binding protein